MGYKKSLDVAGIVQQINAAAYECSSPYNDGFVSWGTKQDLYRIKEILDSAIRRCPTFAPEEEWLREQEKKKVIRILKDEL
jgi:hypothetical protein